MNASPRTLDSSLLIVTDLSRRIDPLDEQLDSLDEEDFFELYALENMRIVGVRGPTTGFASQFSLAQRQNFRVARDQISKLREAKAICTRKVNGQGTRKL